MHKPQVLVTNIADRQQGTLGTAIRAKRTYIRAVTARRRCISRNKKEDIMNKLQDTSAQRQEAIHQQWLFKQVLTMLLTFFRYYLPLLIHVVFVSRCQTFSFCFPFLRLIHRWLYPRKFALFPSWPWMA